MPPANLHGANSVNNMSLAGWTEAHHVAHPVALVADMVVASVAATVIWLRRNDRTAIGAVQLGIVAYTTMLLVAGISELHFYLPLLGMALVRLALAPSSRVVAC